MGGVFRAVTRIFRRPKQVIIQQPAQTQPATVDAPAPTDAKTSSAMAASKAGSYGCLLYTSPSPRDYAASRMPSSA